MVGSYWSTKQPTTNWLQMLDFPTPPAPWITILYSFPRSRGVWRISSCIASTTLMFSLAEVSKKGHPMLVANAAPSCVDTSLLDSRSHLFPQITCGRNSTPIFWSQYPMCYHKIGRLKDSTRTFSVLQNSCSAYRISYHWHLLVSDSCDPVIHRLGLIKRAAACDGVHKHEAISLAHILHKKLTAQTQLQHSPYQEKGMAHCSHPTGEVLCASNSDHYANLPGLSWQSTPPGPQYQECPANMSATEPNQ